MQGFKSFADKTELVFDQQVVGGVGPNGCGKSNIVDAIRWAMGEQSAKGLRGKEMADVIFAGTPARKPAGYAVVSLIFDNSSKQAPAPYTDCSEIMITRRLYRTGDSEYLINNVSARLKDINDLFLGTGSSAKAYSIVAQGKVDQVVLAKPEDRRFLIEEAAGIAKYKVRKQSAERKMELTKQNIERVQDILSELEKNARHLDRQVERAEKFRELQKELRRLDEQVISGKLRKIDQSALQNQKNLEESQQEHQKLSTQLREVEALLEKSRLESLNQEKLTNSDYERLMQRKEDLSQRSTEFELAVQKISLLQNQIEERKKDVHRLDSKFDDQEVAKKQIQEELKDYEANFNKKDEEGKALKAQLQEAQDQLTQIERDLEAKQAELHEAKTAGAREKQKTEMLQAERVEAEFQRASVERSMEELLSNKTLLLSEIQFATEALEQKKEQAAQKAAEIETEETARDQEIQKLQAYITQEFELQKQLTQKQAQRDSLKILEDHKVGYDSGALAFKEKTGRDFLMELLRFRPECQELGEVLLSHIGQTFLIEGGERESLEAGRWSKILIREDAQPLSRTAYDLVEDCSSETLCRILKSIELVDELDQGYRAHAQLDLKGRWRNPLCENVFIEAQGSILRDQTPFSRQQELKELQDENLRLEEALFEKQGQMTELKNEIETRKLRLEELQADLEVLQQEHRTDEVHLSEKREKQIRLEANEERNLEALKTLDEKISDLLASIETAPTDTRLEQLEVQLKELNERWKAQNAIKADLDSRWIEFRIEMGAVTERMERLREQSVSVDMTQTEYAHNQRLFKEDIENWTNEIEQLKRRSEELTQGRETILQELQDLELNLAKTKESLDRWRREAEESEAIRKQYQSQKEEIGDQLKNLEMQKQDLRFQVEELSQLLMERYQIGIEEAIQACSEEDLEKIGDSEQLQAMESKATQLRDRLAHFGDVNLVALQEYDEIKLRLDTMSRQKEDLLQTLDSLQNIIARINRITEFRFRETFRSINHNFEILFPKLFGGGKAYMSLTNEEDLLNTGVEIFAEPPGKKIQAMSLLSGGEKAMTSISLIFSLFAYRPSSFCILDEVDAPLDDINTRRYNDIIKEMSLLSQFIVITHNKRTMEVASTLFGVTMQDPGSSRIVGVNLQEARAFTGTA